MTLLSASHLRLSLYVFIFYAILLYFMAVLKTYFSLSTTTEGCRGKLSKY